MNDNTLMIRTLVDRFFDGDTTLDEEERLYAFFRRPPAELPEDLRPLREMFLDLPAIQYVLRFQAKRQSRAATESQQTRQPKRWLRWAAAVAVALLVAGGAAALFIHGAEADDDCVAYIYGQRTTDRTVVLSEMQKTMTALSATDGSDVVEEQLKSMFSH